VTKKYLRHYECPTEFAMDVLGGKWKTVIMAYLGERPMRYSELHTLMPKLSEKVLTDRLRDLVTADLIIRRKSATVNGVELYTLTERGESLTPILTRLYAWGIAHAKTFGVQVGAPLKRLRESTKAQSAQSASKGRAKSTGAAGKRVR
jgi:DNA-binding HxlR family transcriptional regulator